eukprot:CAMPEP_0174728350 /NCGR_PEP_ID=MMETSP1094-20130205/51572_1 /TAXON_ID=156173 /ORGANISM="Chrysochromulina brevifilum, Strain UTEX LB 985" /LENGTH=112 /DNA_ID=CAMNT_0015930247 /DNA_START=298 /DNA_END=632 /DNA_ORIENTATION=-
MPSVLAPSASALASTSSSCAAFTSARSRTIALWLAASCSSLPPSCVLLLRQIVSRSTSVDASTSAASAVSFSAIALIVALAASFAFASTASSFELSMVRCCCAAALLSSAAA